MVLPPDSESAPPSAVKLDGPVSFERGGQQGWAHDEGHLYGTFHTYDALDVSARQPPHKVHLLLPRGYGKGEERYPVVYLLEGNTAFWPGGPAGKSWDVAGRLSRLAGQGRVADVIVVAIHPVNRDREYTHADWAEGARDWGGLPGFARYLSEDVRTFIDENYRTLAAPAGRAVVGADHGGLAAFYIASARPGVFGRAGCLSPSFWAGLASGSFGGTFAELMASPLLDVVHATLQDPAIRPKLWLDWGLKRDGGDHNRDLEARTATAGQEMVQLLVDAFGYWRQDFHDGDTPDSFADLFTFSDPIGGHDEAAWSWRFGLMMTAFFPSA